MTTNSLDAKRPVHEPVRAAGMQGGDGRVPAGRQHSIHGGTAHRQGVSTASGSPAYALASRLAVLLGILAN